MEFNKGKINETDDRVKHIKNYLKYPAFGQDIIFKQY